METIVSLLEKKLKGYSVNQLVSKLQRGCPENEKSICVEILKKRDQDVSKWETVKEEEIQPIQEVKAPVESIEDLRTEVYEFIDTLIENHRDGIYNEVMKVLGGSFEDDLDDLFKTATESQLKEALSFKKIKESKKKEEKSALIKLKDILKDEKKPVIKEKKDKVVKASDDKAKSHIESVEVDGLKVGDDVKMSDGSYGCITKMFFSHKNTKEICKVKKSDGSFVHKRTDRLEFKK